ncbi:hypothetical protein [Kosakonia oryziphila]|uniref:hypothetical protein n=1 Tax=Kosakonia oryziphila TaxID=1005667 RepID=UPI001FCA1CE3|nr:hypothetical protein [Kosakonia oryziphila]
MRIATITNYAYIATVVLTLTSGIALFMASSAEHRERDTVARSRTFDALTDALEREAFALSDIDDE